MKRKVLSCRTAAFLSCVVLALLMAAALSCAPARGLSANAAPAGGNGLLEIILIDVGQGDSALIKSPDGKFLLIDSGEQRASRAVLEAIKDSGASRIDYIVSTHPHSDHIGGFSGILGKIEIGEVFDLGKPHTTSTYISYLELVKSCGARFCLARAGASFRLGSSVKVSFLWPKDDMPYDMNDSSCVLHIEYMQFDALFTGDIGSGPEGLLTDSGMVPDVELLKVAHHGSRRSSSASFLEAASPGLAVIQVGAGNDYGYPHPQAIERITATDAELFRTDKDGSVIVTSDGTSWWARSEKGRAASGRTKENRAVAPVPTEVYVGSLNSAVFHLQGCDSVKDILKANLVTYPDREDAIRKGKRPCKVCNP